MRNIGPKSAALLRQVGIRTRDDLTAVGVVAAYFMVQQAGARPSLSLLWALDGAVRNVDWRALSEKRKRQLTTDLDMFTAAQVAN